MENIRDITRDIEKLVNWASSKQAYEDILDRDFSKYWEFHTYGSAIHHIIAELPRVIANSLIDQGWSEEDCANILEVSKMNSSRGRYPYGGFLNILRQVTSHEILHGGYPDRQHEDNTSISPLDDTIHLKFEHLTDSIFGFILAELKFNVYDVDNIVANIEKLDAKYQPFAKHYFTRTSLLYIENNRHIKNEIEYHRDTPVFDMAEFRIAKIRNSILNIVTNAYFHHTSRPYGLFDKDGELQEQKFISQYFRTALELRFCYDFLRANTFVIKDPDNVTTLVDYCAKRMKNPTSENIDELQDLCERHLLKGFY